MKSLTCKTVQLLLHYRPNDSSCAKPLHSCMGVVHVYTGRIYFHNATWRCNLGVLHKLPHPASLLSSSYFPSSAPPPHASLSPSALLRLSSNQIKETPGNLGRDSKRTRSKREREIFFKAWLYCRVCVCICCTCCWGIYLWDSTLSALERVFFILNEGGGKKWSGGGGGGERGRELV